MTNESSQYTLDVLRQQHDELRRTLDRCEQLADEVERGRNPDLLAEAVARLRVTVAAHNQFEEQELRPLLRAGNAFAAAWIERMINDHVEEHRAMRGHLYSDEPAGLRETLDSLRAHLDAEERYLLSTNPKL